MEFKLYQRIYYQRCMLLLASLVAAYIILFFLR